MIAEHKLDYRNDMCVFWGQFFPHLCSKVPTRFILPATGLHSALVRESSLSSGGQSTVRYIITQSAIRIKTLFNSKWNIYFNTTITKWKRTKKRYKSLRMRRNLSEALSSELDMATTWLLQSWTHGTKTVCIRPGTKIKPAPSIAANELQTFSHTDELSALTVAGEKESGQLIGFQSSSEWLHFHTLKASTNCT